MEHGQSCRPFAVGAGHVAELQGLLRGGGHGVTTTSSPSVRSGESTSTRSQVTGKVVAAPYLMHGKTSEICHDNRTVFEGLPYRFQATRYHSLMVERKSLPKCLEISATSTDGLIMGLRHKEHPIEGVQFHPESILTAQGKKLLENFLKLT